METTREETAINIAVINKVSKQVATACKLKSNDLLDEALSSGADIPALASSIIAYIKEDRDPILYKQLMHLANTDPIRKYIRTQSGYRKAREVKEIADAVDQLDKFGNDLYYREGNGEYENLLPFFSNEEAQGLLQRLQGHSAVQPEGAAEPGFCRLRPPGAHRNPRISHQPDGQSLCGLF